MAVKIFPTVRSAFANITVAQLAAGYNLVPAAADRKYTIIDGWVRSTGSFGNAHATIGDGTTTVIALLHEGLTNLAVLRFGAANAAGTNMLTALLVNKPITVISDALETTATRLEIYVEYAVSTVGETA